MNECVSTPEDEGTIPNKLYVDLVWVQTDLSSNPARVAISWMPLGQLFNLFIYKKGVNTSPNFLQECS